MRIGQLAAMAGVNIQTVRFYERRKILPAPPRSAAGYRQYRQSDLDDLHVVRRCQQLGFTLNEIQQLLQLHRAVGGLPNHGGRPPELRQIAELGRRRLEHIEEKLRTLRLMRTELVAMLDRLETASTAGCPASVSHKPREVESRAERGIDSIPR
jgi:DNA-binding transcriptional MerR regulator